MDAILQYLNAAAGYATVVGFTVIVGTMYIILTYPALVAWVCIAALATYLIRKNKRVRRLWLWHVWYRIQRGLHKLIVPPRRWIIRNLMCRIKKSVLADKIEDFLQKLQDEGHINRHDHRELAFKIGRALDLADIVPKGRRWRKLTAEIVKKNCEEMKKSAPIAKIPGAPEPAEAGHQELRYLRNRNAA